MLAPPPPRGLHYLISPKKRTSKQSKMRKVRPWCTAADHWVVYSEVTDGKVFKVGPGPVQLLGGAPRLTAASYGTRYTLGALQVQGPPRLTAAS